MRGIGSAWVSVGLLAVVACAPQPVEDSGAQDGFSEDDGAFPAWLFSTTAPLPEMAIELDADAEDLLRTSDGLGRAPWVDGRFVDPEGGVHDISVRLSGKLDNSFRPYDEKPYLKIAFQDDVPFPLAFRLYNMAQELSGTQRVLGYEVFRRAGYPAAEAGYAMVSINGSPKGLYGVTEEVDEGFVARRAGDVFTSRRGGSLYEGNYGEDVEPSTCTCLGAVFDEAGAGADLCRIADALASADPCSVRDAGVDWDRWLEFWALETLVGAGEGYTYEQNNYFLYRDQGSGQWTPLPWGFDSVLTGEGGGVEPCAPTGALAVRTLDPSASCASDYRAALRDVLDRVDLAALEPELDRLASVLDGWDPSAEGLPFDRQDVAAHRELVRSWLREREGALEVLAAEGCPTIVRLDEEPGTCGE